VKEKIRITYILAGNLVLDYGGVPNR